MYIQSILIFIKDRINCFHLYKFDAFTESSCRNPVSRDLGTICINEDLHKLETNAQISNFHKCPIKIVAWDNSPPYTSFKEGNVIFFEGKILNEFSKLTNLTLVADELESNFYRNQPLKVLTVPSDVFCGEYILTPGRADRFSYSFPHDTSSMVMFLKNEKILKTSFEILLAPFDWWSWTSLLISWFFGVISISLMTRTDIASACILLLSLILGVPVHFRQTQFHMRLQYLTWLVLGLTFSIVHHVVFFDILQTSLTKPLPNTLAKLLKINYSRTFFTYDYIFFDIFDANEDIQNASMKYVWKHPSEFLIEMFKIEERVIGVATSRVYEWRTKGFSDLLYRLPERFMTIFNTIYFEKNSFLLNDMNKMILDLYGGGILEKWMFDIVGKRRSSELVQRFRKLSLVQLGGIFEIYLIFIIVSFTVFIGEIWHHRFYNKII